MSNKNFASIQNVVQHVASTISLENLAAEASASLGGEQFSLESLGAGSPKLLADTREALGAKLIDAFNAAGTTDFNVGLENYEEGTPEYDMAAGMLANAKKTVGILAAAAGNPYGFAKAGLESRFASTADAQVVIPSSAFGSAGDVGYLEKPVHGLEAYDNKNLTDFLPYSVAFNVYGQRQDEYSELLFKTFVVPPEQAGVEISASRLLVYRDQNRTNPNRFDMGKRNLIDAHVDYQILKDESTRLLPVADPDGTNDGVLVPASLVGTSYEMVGGVSVPTRPYKVATPIELIAASTYQPLVGSKIQTNQDAVDSAIRLKSVVMQVADGKPGIIFPTAELPENEFQRALTGNYRDMVLNFDTRGVIVTSETLASDGSEVSAFSGIPANWSVALQFSLNGRVNLEKANLGGLNPSNVIVAGVFDADGNAVSLTAGTGLAIVTALAPLSVAGFELLVNRTNSDRSTRGLRLDTTLVRERYNIPLSSPLSVARPNDPYQQQQATDLKAIVTAARIRNSNNAITAQFNIIASLQAYVTAPFKMGQDDSAAIGGLGRLLVDPYFRSEQLNLVTALNNTASGDKAEDVQGAIVNKIRDISFDMLQKSNYQAALESQVGGPGVKPTLFVGTDQVLIRHIMITGDDRTFTPMFDTAIVKETLDARMRGKIFLTFIRPDATEPDVLSFGAHLWSTELVSTLQVTRSGESNSIETMVQPRTLHINMMPVCAIIEVTGLDEVLGTAINYNVLATLNKDSSAGGSTGTGTNP